MKKVLIILSIILLSIGANSCYYFRSDKKMLKDFAFEITDKSIKLDSVIFKYIQCDSSGKEMALFLLKYCRENQNLKQNQIKIYSYYESLNFNTTLKNISEEYDKSRVYLIHFNDKLKMPILLNENSKIIAVSFGLDKGDNVNYFRRLDGKK
ncbi:hypothetical protein D3C86_1030110 [compost metagenome]